MDAEAPTSQEVQYQPVLHLEPEGSRIAPVLLEQVVRSERRRDTPIIPGTEIHAEPQVHAHPEGPVYQDQGLLGCVLLL